MSEVTLSKMIEAAIDINELLAFDAPIKVEGKDVVQITAQIEKKQKGDDAFLATDFVPGAKNSLKIATVAALKAMKVTMPKIWADRLADAIEDGVVDYEAPAKDKSSEVQAKGKAKVDEAKAKSKPAAPKTEVKGKKVDKKTDAEVEAEVMKEVEGDNDSEIEAEVVKEVKKAAKDAKLSNKSIFGHNRSAISGKIDEELIANGGTLETIAAAAGCDTARAKAHINHLVANKGAEITLDEEGNYAIVLA
jgi:hypothetical protein